MTNIKIVYFAAGRWSGAAAGAATRGVRAGGDASFVGPQGLSQGWRGLARDAAGLGRAAHLATAVQLPL